MKLIDAAREGLFQCESGSRDHDSIVSTFIKNSKIRFFGIKQILSSDLSWKGQDVVFLMARKKLGVLNKSKKHQFHENSPQTCWSCYFYFFNARMCLHRNKLDD